jgi:hypothetical protein
MRSLQIQPRVSKGTLLPTLWLMMASDNANQIFINQSILATEMVRSEV